MTIVMRWHNQSFGYSAACSFNADGQGKILEGQGVI
jgi:hypothetical protein